ncbi:KinB activator protein [Alteribacter lacisalsi]|uniref:KinB activator protein n=1 Tax=Alteribacter lacisalsi TaxID=2045244 RepID=A0A2W0HQ45_9BACI|nr:KinB-signaling pathway activation protein [Alteribacter lacisalsi]PYZ95698.1 KinB activator protein [Alteribacter lacisalsi]
MNTRKVVFLFWSTFLIGTTAGLLMGIMLDFNTHMQDLRNGQVGGVFMLFIGAGIWTIIAQMGFFAYLTIHRFGLGIFKSTKLWNRIQVVLILFALFDLMLFRYWAFGTAEETITDYAILPFLLLVYAVIVAYLKAKDTNFTAFIPALFFMVVVTTIEWIPALRENDMTFLLTAIVPLLVANTWQLLVLHRLHEQPN